MKDRIVIDGVTYVREDCENEHSAAGKYIYRVMPKIKTEILCLNVGFPEHAENIICGHILTAFQEGIKWAQEQTKKG